MIIQQRKVKRKRKKNALRMYFHSGTQDAIVAYQKSSSNSEREQIYVKDILPAFEKLTENLINIHRFTSLFDSFDDLKNDCINFLFETLLKFDPLRGTNAFSYFNVVAKNFLIIKTKKKTQMMKKSVSLDDPDSLSNNENAIIEEHCVVPSQEVLLENAMVANNIIDVLYQIRLKAKTENELIAINSIITIFESIDELDLMNKSAILLYMRELSGLSPKQLTTTLQSIKRHYKRLKTDVSLSGLF